MLLHITLSTTIKHIVREDGEDENGVTKLVMALLNHYPTLRRIRWADDVTRAGRDRADWSQITTKCKHRDIVMVFGGQSYDQSKPGDELALGALGMVGGNDDPARRRKLTGKRLMKYKLGGAAIAEKQMPHGWHHKKDKHGRPVNEGDRGLVPEGRPGDDPGHSRALYDAHADGRDVPGDRATHGRRSRPRACSHRRDHTDLDNTYARTLDDPLARYDAAKSFFVRSSFRPRRPPSELAIARYLEGEDPADVFDADTRLYLAKVELVRTGRYFRRLKQRHPRPEHRPGRHPGHPTATTATSTAGSTSCRRPWAWPVDDVRIARSRGSGSPTRPAARSPHDCSASSARPRQPTGGQAHRTPTPPRPPGLRELDDPARATRRRGTTTRPRSGAWRPATTTPAGPTSSCSSAASRPEKDPARGRGWSYFGPGERKPDHIAATGSLAELAASVAFHLDAAVRNLADPT